MMKFLKKHYGAILFIVPCLFMFLSFYYSPFRLRPKEDMTGHLLNFLFVLPGMLLMGWFVCWEITRALGREYSMERTFKEYNGFILFAIVSLSGVCALIVSPERPRLSDLPSSLDNPIVETLLGGLLVTLTILLIGWGQELAGNWSLSGKRRRLSRIQNELTHFKKLQQDPEKLVLELTGAIKTALKCLSLSLAGGVLTAAFLVMLTLSIQPNPQGFSSTFSGLLSRSSPAFFTVAEGSIIIFNAAMFAFGIKACLGALKLAANVRNFQAYQGKAEERIKQLNLSIHSG